MLDQAVLELKKKLLELDDISYDSIDSLMRKIMKSYNVTARELHNSFKNKYKKTPDDWIKEKMKKIHEDHKEIASGKKTDDEGYMARNELDSIEKAVQNLRKSIKSGKQQLPAWVQSKITKAADYIDTAAEYLQSDEKVNEDKLVRGILKGSDPKTQIKKSSGAGALTPNAAKQLGPKAVELQKKKAAKVSLPSIKKEEVSLVEKILGEEKCGKGMYWCNTDKVCKPLPEGMKVPGQKVKPTEVGIGKPVGESCAHTGEGKPCPIHGKHKCPMSEEKDPKGPTKSYKTPEEIAKKHGVSVEEIKKQLEMGTKVEFEHTTSKSEARITALQHLDELPNYYSKLKKMEHQKESVTVEDANGNPYVEFIDLIKPDPIKEDEDPCWKGYTQVGMKMKNGKKVPNCVPSKGVPKAKGYKKESVDEAARMPAKTGNNVFVTLSWRGKYYSIQVFFPQAKVPSRSEISDEIQKIYPGSRVVTHRIADFTPGEPILYANKGGSGGKLGANKNYVKPMGEEVEILDEKK
jgi:vacuolar-type H+-ATPase subunit H